MRSEQEIRAKGREVLDQLTARQFWNLSVSGDEEAKKEAIALEGAARALAWVLGMVESATKEAAHAS